MDISIMILSMILWHIESIFYSNINSFFFIIDENSRFLGTKAYDFFKMWEELKNLNGVVLKLRHV